jgi:hypothetical protein
MGSPLAAFLEWENVQVEKHEFVGGGVHAISDSRRVHGVVSLDLFALLRQQLRGSLMFWRWRDRTSRGADLRLDQAVDGLRARRGISSLI